MSFVTDFSSRLPFGSAPLKDVVTLDFEASGLGARSYPIEVAVNFVTTGEARTWLIKPTSEWLTRGEWMPAAEKLHGLTQEQLMRYGRDPQFVLQELEYAVEGKTVLSDRQKNDNQWLVRLAEAAGHEKPPFVIEQFEDYADRLLARKGKSPDQMQHYAETLLEDSIKPHRAQPDATFLAKLLNLIAD